MNIKLAFTILGMVYTASSYASSTLDIDFKEGRSTSAQKVKTLDLNNAQHVEQVKSGSFLGEHAIIRVVPTPWAHLQPYMTQLIEQTISNHHIQERTFSLQINREDYASYYQWSEWYRKLRKYPISMGEAGVGASGDKVEGLYEIYHKELTVHNYTMRENSSRKVNEYKFYCGELDAKLINEKTLHNLMARVGLTETDFKNGCTGLQGRIFVKPIDLKNQKLSDCRKNLRRIVFETLKKSPEKYVALVINLPSTYKDEFQLDLGGIGILATICEDTENRIYLFISNDRRKVLNLHGFSKKGEFNGVWQKPALQLVRDYITEQYNDFQNDCIINTGRGKHINAGGSRGVLLSAFPKWMEDRGIKSLILKTELDVSGGRFTVFLKKPSVCDLLKSKSKADGLQKVRKSLQRVIESGEDRLLIKTNDPRLDHTLIRILPSLDLGISGVRFNYAPGELRLIFFNPVDHAEGLIITRGQSAQETPLSIKSKIPPKASAPARKGTSKPKAKKTKAIPPKGNKSQSSQPRKGKKKPNPKSGNKGRKGSRSRAERNEHYKKLARLNRRKK